MQGSVDDDELLRSSHRRGKKIEKKNNHAHKYLNNISYVVTMSLQQRFLI